jgi:tetratricopeptide (TPR) repeat protein
VVYSCTGRFDKAIAVDKRALRLSPGDKGLLLNLGLAYMKQDSYADALPAFQKLIESDPRNLQVRELLATSGLHVGRIDRAVARLEILCGEDTQNAGIVYLLGVGYLKQNHADKGRRALETFLESAPPDQAGFILCKAYYESERFDEAAGFCRKILEIDPNFAGGHRELGKVFLSQRNPEATQELAVAVRQNANDSEALYFLGASLLQDGRMAEAKRNLERARELNPGFWGNYFYLGKASLQANQAAEAIPLLKKAAELNSSESAIFYQLGRALAATRQQRGGRARHAAGEGTQSARPGSRSQGATGEMIHRRKRPKWRRL